ncbi:MAG: beta-galactosidase [Candidatus Omnitrophota bacterium]
MVKVMCLVFLGLSLFVSRSNALPAVKTVETRDGRLIVNGKPFFPIGVYHAGHWHKGLRECGTQGFNLVQAYGGSPEDMRKDVDDAFANGMYSALALNAYCEQPELVEKIVLACREAPGLLVWLLEDEPNIRLPEPKDMPYAERPFRLPPAKLKPIYELLKRLDPVHPVWINLAHGYLADHQAYNAVADIQSDDIYPVPGTALPAVASYADVVVQGAAGKVPWLVLQMAPVRPELGDKDRHPTMAEVRCMTYMALAHGITGVAYYSFNERPIWDNPPGLGWRTSESAPAYWAQWADLTTELAALAPYLLAPPVQGNVKTEITEGSDEPGPWNHPALHVSLRKTETGYFLIAVNGFNSLVKARLTLPVNPKAPQAAVRFENRLIPVTESTIEDTFAPYAVHLYDFPMKP